VAERVETLEAFMVEMASLLLLLSACREVLFREGFRKDLPAATEEAASRLREFSRHSSVREPESDSAMGAAGLTGAQLRLKLESFSETLTDFRTEAGQERLEKSLATGSILLSSLAGAIPGFGSFAQELVDFILKELRRRFWRR
jgi:hypothetical protein